MRSPLRRELPLALKLFVKDGDDGEQRATSPPEAKDGEQQRAKQGLEVGTTQEERMPSVGDLYRCIACEVGCLAGYLGEPNRETVGSQF